MKSFFKEFKTFITRGNVIDLAVGVIIGSAFTAIVTALSTHILKPIIDFVLATIFGQDSLAGIFTYLKKVVDAEGVIDLTQSIYIDWGAFINAIINFILIALVLFIIVKTVNKAKDASKVSYDGYTKEEYKKMRKEGKSKEEIAKLAAERDAIKAEEEKKAAEEAHRHSTEGLLEDIKALLEKQAK